MSIYSEFCLEYLKKGLSVIPDNGKKPMVKNWTEYCERQPTKEEVMEWCSNMPKANIAVCLGKQSGIIVLDFDETDPELIKVIEPLLPESPVERFGSKGFARFFRYSGESTQNVYVKDPSKKNGKRVVLEVLSTGKKITIPPSIHPDTEKPYTWTKGNLLDIDVNTLPKFPPMLIPHLQSKLQILESNTYDDGSKITEGRNISLSNQVAKLIKQPHTINEVIDKLIQFDKSTHEVPLFTDPKENEVTNENYNALMFYLNHIKYVNKKRIREGKNLELPIFNSEENILANLTATKPEDVKVSLPIPSGLLKDVYDHILACSYIEQPMFAMSAALILVGTLASRKFTFQNATPNLYLLNIADSGSGKDSCQQIIKDLLFKVKAGQKLLGATSYPSEASIIQNIDASPVRLDIIDEASTFLSAATKGGNSYAQGIGDTLCELYSCSNSYYLGKSLASQSVRVGAVHRPHINLLCSTTYRGIHESVSITSLEKGLFARFLVFFGDNNKPSKRIVKKPKIDESVLDKLSYLYNFVHPNFKQGNFSKYNAPAYKIPLTRLANDRLSEIHAEFDKMRVESKSDNFSKPIIARLYQQMLKVIMISAVGNTDVDNLPVVKPSDVEFGYNLIKYYFQNIQGFVKDNLYESHREMKLNKVLNIIKEAGEEGLTNVDLANKCKFLSSGERIDFIKDLKEANRIYIKADEENTGASYRFFYLGE